MKFHSTVLVQQDRLRYQLQELLCEPDRRTCVNGKTFVKFRKIGESTAHVWESYLFPFSDLTPYALKEVPPHNERFILQESLARIVNDKRIINIIEIDSRNRVVVMELLNGKNLESLLFELDKSNHSLSILQIRQLAIQIAQAVQSIHDAKVVHRDLKPSNIFLTQPIHSKIKIIDFGMADLETSVKCAGGGTYPYCAPEQDTESDQIKRHDRRSDLFSVGMVLYEMVCGISNFDRIFSGSQTHKRSNILPHPIDLRSGISESLSSLIMRCIAYDVSERPSNAKEIAELLKTDC